MADTSGKVRTYRGAFRWQGGAARESLEASGNVWPFPGPERSGARRSPLRKLTRDNSSGPSFRRSCRVSRRRAPPRAQATRARAARGPIFWKPGGLPSANPGSRRSVYFSLLCTAVSLRPLLTSLIYVKTSTRAHVRLRPAHSFILFAALDAMNFSFPFIRSGSSTT